MYEESKKLKDLEIKNEKILKEFENQKKNRWFKKISKWINKITK